NYSLLSLENDRYFYWAYYGDLASWSIQTSHLFKNVLISLLPPDHTLGLPTVISPNGGETLQNTFTIQWSAAIDSLGHTVTYTLYYSETGSNWLWLADSTTNSYNWDTTSVSDGTLYKIKVVATCTGHLTTEDTSDNTFTINNAASTSSWTPTIPSPGFDLYLTLFIFSIATLVALLRRRRE
ncbi:MAG: fibronectin type III domain-containing protein, partial [Promethearchaeota archaeon]